MNKLKETSRFHMPYTTVRVQMRTKTSFKIMNELISNLVSFFSWVIET